MQVYCLWYTDSRREYSLPDGSVGKMLLFLELI